MFTNRRFGLLPILVLGLAMIPPTTAAGDAGKPPRILVFSRTAEFRHDSIAAGIALVQSCGTANGFAVDASEDPAVFTAANLQRYRALVFMNTTGDVLDPPGEAAFEAYIRAGGGFVGVHAAADTEHGWPFYGELLGGGAWFANHPAIQAATLHVESRSELAVQHLPASFSFTDEWYNFGANPRAAVTVLLTIDESTYAPGPGAMGDHPITWQHAVGNGRSWYTNLGHNIATYSDPRFRQLLLGGLLWAARLEIFHDGFETGDTGEWSASFE